VNSLLVALFAFFLTILFIVLLRPVAITVGLTDQPNERKQHVGSVPLVGGIAIFLAFSLSAILSPWLSGTEGGLPENLWVFIAASFILVGAGAWDDWRGLTPRTRFILQICAALTMVSGAGIVIVDLGSHAPTSDHAYLGRFAVPFTVFATVGLINAINMSDGLDGLSGNLTLVSFVGFGAANVIWGGNGALEYMNVLTAAIAGFLVFNQRMQWRPTAAVFLGDAGSMMLGFALAWSAVEISQGPSHALTPVATLWFLVVPVYDTLGVIARRLYAGRSPFYADAGHLHHLFMRAGFSVTGTIAIMCGMALTGVAIGLSVTSLVVPSWLVMGGFVAGWLIYICIVQWAWKQPRMVDGGAT
jgi:UDP-GlcNAc:undecaprenyl-phosphate GlcNAc-1-phosphate transferase